VLNSSYGRSEQKASFFRSFLFNTISFISIDTVIRFLVGGIFLFSSISKIITIDTFEVYVYSLGLLKLNLSFFVAKVLIGLELLIGFLLIIGVYKRILLFIVIFLLTIFILFLIWLQISDQTEQCYCFGDVLTLSHKLSIIKNLSLIGLSSFLLTKKFKRIKYSRIIFIGVFIIAISLPFIVSLPDNLMFESYSKKNSYNEIALFTFLKQSGLNRNGIVCFLGCKCRFCKLAARKMNVMLKEIKNPYYINFIFWGSQNDIDIFFNETNINHYSNLSIDGVRFLRITDGQMPLILLLKEGKVINKFGYRDIDEEKVMQFLTQLQ